MFGGYQLPLTSCANCASYASCANHRCPSPHSASPNPGASCASSPTTSGEHRWMMDYSHLPLARLLARIVPVLFGYELRAACRDPPCWKLS